MAILLPLFVTEISENNLNINEGAQQGFKINVTALGLINAWMDSRLQLRENIVFSRDNDYRTLVDQFLYLRLLEYFDKKIAPAIDHCRRTLDNHLCAKATKISQVVYWDVLRSAMRKFSDFDTESMYFVGEEVDRHPLQGKRFKDYITSKSVQNRINAKYAWRSQGGGMEIRATGDRMRP